MEQLTELFESIINFILGNIGIVIFAIFILSGFIGRGSRSKEGQPQQAERRAQQAQEHDDRPLAERLAEAFGVEIPEEQPTQQSAQQADRRQAAEGRRSTTRRNVQENYPELFGSSSMFDRTGEDAQPTKWGFDETEWGSTFERNEEQWGNTFPERKDSEPRIEWPR